MVKHQIDATIFFKHDPSEVKALTAAMIPLADHLKAVSSPFDRAKIRQILNGEYFRVKEADRMRCLMLRTTRHVRANLIDYFPYMRESIMANAERLEEAVEQYWDEFRYAIDEVRPTR